MQQKKQSEWCDSWYKEEKREAKKRNELGAMT